MQTIQSAPFAFKTGRAYTEHGQRIAAQVLAHTDDGDALLAMVDIDRDIEGLYVVILGAASRVCAADVMRAYDYDMRASFEQREALFAEWDWQACAQGQPLQREALFANLRSIARSL